MEGFLNKYRADHLIIDPQTCCNRVQDMAEQKIQKIEDLQDSDFCFQTDETNDTDQEKW